MLALGAGLGRYWKCEPGPFNPGQASVVAVSDDAVAG